MTYLPMSRRRIDHIVIHCAATMPSLDIGAEDIDRWHKARGWSGIGYHGVIRRNGAFEPGRSVHKTGAHARGFNRNSIGVCLAGGLGRDNRPAPDYTRAQWRTLRRVIACLREQYPDADFVGHRDLPGVAKACPSFDLRHWLATGEVRA
ncbi:MAG: N-acetylmuramoyl-L-alanine amidase [Litorimonas sp.]